MEAREKEGPVVLEMGQRQEKGERNIEGASPSSREGRGTFPL